MLNIISNQRNENQKHIEKTQWKNNKYQHGYGEAETTMLCWECKMVQQLRKIVWWFSKN